MNTKKCANPECGKEFAPPSPISIYCSTRCRGRAAYLVKRDKEGKPAAAKNGRRARTAETSKPAPVPSSGSASSSVMSVVGKALDEWFLALSVEEKLAVAAKA